MNKSDFFKALGRGALAVAPMFPGGSAAVAVESSIEHLTNHDAPVSDTVTDLIINSIMATEQISGKDILNDDLVKILIENVKSDIDILQRVIVLRKNSTSVSESNNK